MIHIVSFGPRATLLLEVSDAVAAITVYNSAGDESLLYVEGGTVELSSDSVVVIRDPVTRRLVLLHNGTISFSQAVASTPQLRNPDNTFGVLEVSWDGTEWRRANWSMTHNEDGAPGPREIRRRRHWYARARERLAQDLWAEGGDFSA